MSNPSEQMGGGENASLLRCCNAVSRPIPPPFTFSPSLPPGQPQILMELALMSDISFCGLMAKQDGEAKESFASLAAVT